MRFDKYIGLAFEDFGDGPEAYDCWGFVRLVMRESFGVDLPRLSYSEDREERLQLVKEHSPGFSKVSAPQHGALVLFFMEGRRPHIGVCLNGTDVLHMTRHGSVLTPLDAKWICNGIDGYYLPPSR